MRIERFRAKNYRIFKEIDFVFPRTNCLIIVDDNERGKSSLLLGILSCLYCHRQDPSVTRESYLELEFTLKGHKYRVLVNGDKKRLFEDEKDITPSIYRKVGRAYRYLVGESLIGLNKEEFINTALVKQHELIRSAISNHSGSIVPKIQSMVEISSEEHNSAKAIELLRKGLEKNFPRVTLKNRAKGDARQELKSLQRRLDDALNKKNRILMELSEEDTLVRQYEEILQKINKTEEAIKLNELKRDIALLEEEKNKRQQIDKLNQELSSLMPCAEISLSGLLDIESVLKGEQRYLESERQELKKKLAEITESEKKIARLDEELKSFIDLQGKGIDQALKLQDLSTSLSELNTELYETEKTHHDQILAFPASLEDFEKLHKTVQQLSAQDLKLLEEYPEEQKRLKDSEQLLKSIRMLTKKRQIALLSAIFLIVLSIVMFFISKGLSLLSLMSLPVLYYYLRLSKQIKSLQMQTTLKLSDLDEIKKKIILNEEGIRRIRELYRIDSASYKEYLRLVHDYKNIKESEEKIEFLREKKARLLSEINSIYPFRDEPSAEEINYLIKRIKRYVELERESEFQKERLQEQTKEAEGIRERIKNSVEKVKELLKNKLMVSVDNIPEEELFSAGFRAIERTKRAIEIKKLLSEIELLQEEDLENLKKEIKSRVDKLSPGNMPRADNPPSYYEEKIRIENERLRELYSKKNSFESRRREILSLRDTLSELDRTFANIRSRISFTEQYIKAIVRAINLLQNLSLTGFSIWAERLNNETTKIFSSLTGSNRKIVFGKDLNFRIVSDDEELTDKEAQWYLSGGTLEQLYLAIRVTVSEHITPQIKLPLLLDEPFAHADDDRFLRAMQFITSTLSSRRQVIILSCHRQRHLQIKNMLQGDFYIIDGII